MTEWHPAFEEYCETIYELAEDDVEVIQARIAERMGISRPAVSEMIKRLEHEGLVEIDGNDPPHEAGPGARRASRAAPSARGALPHRHPAAVVGRCAPRGRQVGARDLRIGRGAIDRVLGEPTTCPHGNPIPGSSYSAPDAHPLSALSVGASFTVSRIPEELEFTPGLLDFLEESAITPGRIGTITAASPDGTVTVEIEGHSVGVGAFASDRILVTA